MRNYAEIVHKFPQVHVLVVGDSMMDIYHFGHVDRLSPEAPVPVFIEDSQKGRPGGAANVAANLTSLGCQVKSIFARGDITTKHRYLVGHQQLFRIDQDVIRAPSITEMNEAADLAHDWADVVVLSDYAKGWLTKTVCRALIASGKPVIVDPKGGDWEKYIGAFCICPNEREQDDYIRHPAATRPVWKNLLMKRGANGIELIEAWNQPCRRFPAQAKQVFDVTGAGDTVVAVVAAVVGAGGTLPEACVLANHAAGVVVGKVGTSECSAEELLCALDSPMAASTASTPDIDSFYPKPESVATGSSSPSTPTRASAS
jgi:bifunctional ADP-heptose synthase (sugar kinase/adenylyltransferase)